MSILSFARSLGSAPTAPTSLGERKEGPGYTMVTQQYTGQSVTALRKLIVLQGRQTNKTSAVEKLVRIPSELEWDQGQERHP